MINACNNQHQSISFEGHVCPLCSYRAHSRELMCGLQDRIVSLEHDKFVLLRYVRELEEPAVAAINREIEKAQHAVHLFPSFNEEVREAFER